MPLMMAVLQQRSDTLREAREQTGEKPVASPAPRVVPDAPVFQHQDMGKGRQRSTASVSFSDIVDNDKMKGSLLGMINSAKGSMKG